MVAALPPPPAPFIPQTEESGHVKVQEQESTEPTNVVDMASSRAGMTTPFRLAVMSGLGGFWGFSMGCFLGGRQAGLQYLAENAHKLPTTVQGWYFYHKTKNYRMMLGGIKRGTRYAVRTGGLCLTFGAIEAGMDHVRGGQKDVINSMAAGMTTAALFSAFSRLTRGSVRHSLVFGAAFGFIAGSLNDVHQYASGHPPRYIEWIHSQIRGSTRDAT